MFIKSVTFWGVLFLAMFFSVCVYSGERKTPCDAWLKSLIRQAESVPMENRYEKILEIIATGCEVIPPHLQKAAKNSLGKPLKERRVILMAAVTPYFSEVCIQENPNMRANKLLHICLGSDFPDGEFSAVLEDLNAATYLFGKALQKEFVRAGVYEKYGQRIVATFFLSNALSLEGGS